MKLIRRLRVEFGSFWKQLDGWSDKIHFGVSAVCNILSFSAGVALLLVLGYGMLMTYGLAECLACLVVGGVLATLTFRGMLNRITPRMLA